MLNHPFIHTEELVERYPDLTPKNGNFWACKEFGAAFLLVLAMYCRMENLMMDVHQNMMTGQLNLKMVIMAWNGDILVWNDNLGAAFKLSSMHSC